MADIKGTDPLICTHRMTLEDSANLIRQMQRIFNPIMKEVVKAKVLKLLDLELSIQ